MTVIPMIPTDSQYLPPKVVEVSRDVIRHFPHSKKVGNYLLGETLGEGSFAKVKRALHIPTGEKVAIKIVDKKKTKEDSYVRKNLRREGKLLQMARHPNIVQLYEVMETENSYYLVTELCKGGDLMEYISQRKKLQEPEVRKFIRQIVSAIDYLHRLGILHRDLKIENLLLDENLDIKIIDFGLSNSIKVVHTKEGTKAQEYCVTQCGSPAYAAPELLGRNKYGPQVDVWSIGVNMYAMLTGNLPFTVEPFNIKTLHTKMINGGMNPLPEGMSRDGRDLIKKFLVPDPERRIRLEEALKHPWLADGPGNPMCRAPCPNRMKTDSLDNSILKHMSEVQGFRLSEVIRAVTGNFPGCATSMYHLLWKKLTKHLGDLRASGKIPVDHRLLNRQSTSPVSEIKDRFATPQRNVTKRPHPQNNQNNIKDGTKKDSSQESKENAKPSTDSEGNRNGKGVKEEANETSEDSDSEFTDLLTFKEKTDGQLIPRAKLTTKPAHNSSDLYTNGVISRPPQLPIVANKYVIGNLHRKILHDAHNTSQVETTTSESEDGAAPVKGETAKTFAVNNAAEAPHWKKVIGQPLGQHKTSITINPKLLNQVQQNGKYDMYQYHMNLSPFRTPGKQVPQGKNSMSLTPRPTPHIHNSHVYSAIKKQSGTHIHGKLVHVPATSQNGRKNGVAASWDNTKSNQNSANVSPVFSRPSAKFNKIPRIKLEMKNELTVEERISQISSVSRPFSSRSTNASTRSFRNTSSHPGLPNISPPLLPVSRKH